LRRSLRKRRNHLMQELLILGGGYGNMRLLQEILSDVPDDLQITLVDRLPYHCLKTEYYALAAGTKSDSHIRIPFPEHSRLKIQYGEVSSIQLEEQDVHLTSGEKLTYDQLVIGLGSEDKYHNIPGADEYTLSIQTIDKARKSYQELNNLRRKGVVSIVGGGLSGVELASELNESRPDLTIRLFDRGDTILSTFSKRLSKYVQEWMIEHGVNIINQADITKVEENILYDRDEPVRGDAIVWTAGIQPHWLVRELDVEKDDHARLTITPHHHLPDYPNVFVIGDCASLPHAPSAQLAELQADQVATVFKKKWKDEPLPNLSPIKLKGVFGSLGKKQGFGMMGGTTLTGRVPRLLKSGILWMYKHHNG
jgi:NADH dehydrogenase